MSPPENRLSEHSVFHDTSTPSPHPYHVFEEAVSKYGAREAVVALHQEPHLYADSLNKEPSKGPGLRWTYKSSQGLPTHTSIARNRVRLPPAALGNGPRESSSEFHAQ
ncbi:hypothetical protein INS49_012570 [Diaporthe citri]|uniref:uncharacterized protein n=1 Tax=Diaporthe citri TaxID=83186 RepID=UPI001C7EADDA|nr:uncharacterized protein INS49_012570 [Diaporthe citri]KAG6359050.1 hypothetical protein INS49_012570 [Diaporthe citri]